MSKQEKLAELLEAVRNHCNWTRSSARFPVAIEAAFAAYEATPDDPPQPPEMPERVADLCRWVEVETSGLSTIVKAVRDYYAKPLKLEKGQVYEDADGEQIEIVWVPSAGVGVLTGIQVKNGLSRFYEQNGKCPPYASLVRRIS